MATYITLLNWTERGVSAYKDTARRAEDFSAALNKLGARLVDIYWTDGPYDLVCIIEAPDDETATAASLRLGALGNVRTTTLRAFGREEMRGIIAKAAG
ncbi:GYD domain-containing protein [Streptomyces antimycoticus]|uniref:GYD domain-containing protein n=3 Tax=Streptomyces TaxID=1883 RepID=A0ABD5JJH7_9ACTN|nr:MULTISPECIES: GYD domain-containing protein [Streptomyces]MEE4588406.1 GYD domain-containing protein [Streptomyces sp. DSM 41602]KUL44212.1 GYD family protein [Streptomyces violaceusniger]QTI89148.1 GYD domain-containing protein [Streptomyces sp. AgN23]RSS33906.1 GYD domain-containing protein [Streptomyces sp. WAC05858]WJD97738.1 GYD domain-containing protein [Streptomyces antimycoticus]